MPEIEILPAESTDYPRLIGLDHSYQSSYVWQIDRVVEAMQVSINFREIRLPRVVRLEYPYSREQMERDWGKHPVVLIAGIKDTTVGYVYLKEGILPYTAWVKHLVVRPDMRRKGIASGLALAAQEWALQRSLRRVVIEMQSKNHPAIRMAMKLGFDFSGYQDRFYPNHDLALFFSRYLR